jgi:hypothetical protein
MDAYRNPELHGHLSPRAPHRALSLLRRQRSNVTAGETVETVGILRGARTTQLKLGVNERRLGPARYRNFFIRVLAVARADGDFGNLAAAGSVFILGAVNLGWREAGGAGDRAAGRAFGVP